MTSQRKLPLSLWERMGEGISLWETFPAVSCSLWETLPTALCSLGESHPTVPLSLWERMGEGISLWETLPAVPLSLWERWVRAESYLTMVCSLSGPMEMMRMGVSN